MKPATQDIDAGRARSSPAKEEPHREHDVRDRGGLYAREQQDKAPRPQRIDRKTAEHNLPRPSDPDDPAGQ